MTIPLVRDLVVEFGFHFQITWLQALPPEPSYIQEGETETRQDATKVNASPGADSCEEIIDLQKQSC